jgi:hypothetical protein
MIKCIGSFPPDTHFVRLYSYTPADNERPKRQTSYSINSPVVDLATNKGLTARQSMDTAGAQNGTTPTEGASSNGG